MQKLYKKIYYKNTFQHLLNKYKYDISAGNIVAGIIKYPEINRFLVDIGDNIASYLPDQEIYLDNCNYKQNFLFFIYLIRDFFLITYTMKKKISILSIKRLNSVSYTHLTLPTTSRV